MLDDHGQPLIRTFNRERLSDRSIDELIGMSRGIASDGIVNQKEAEFLKSWMEANISYCDDPLVNQLYRRVQEMLVDRVLDHEEQAELFELLKMFSGNICAGEVAANMTSSLPLDKPPPQIEFPTMYFCLTGKFAYGPRRACVELIKECGGVWTDLVNPDTDYLVVGYLGSSDWIHTSYGRKIERAMELRQGRSGIAIVSEDHWAKSAFKI